MEKLIADILSPYWWASVVVVGLVLNVLATYLVRPIDRWRDRRRARNQQATAALNDEIFTRELVLIKFPALVAVEEGKLSRAYWSLAWNLAWGFFFLGSFAWIAEKRQLDWSVIAAFVGVTLFAFAGAWAEIRNARKHITLLEAVDAKLSAAAVEAELG